MSRQRRSGTITAERALNDRRRLLGWTTLAFALLAPSSALADEGGVSFWLPGFYGSLVAVPAQPGLSGAAIFYHASIDADGAQLQRGLLLAVGLEGTVDVNAFGPNYVFKDPVLGGQLALGLFGIFGHGEATVSATLTGPGGGQISGHRSQSLTGFGDLLPVASLKWNDGVDNFMTYIVGGIPVGAYDPDRLINLGIGHGAIDVGGAYTFLNPQTGWELSATLGVTFNFENTDTDYTNGVDGHLDVGISRFIDKQIHLGLVGYVYQQITGDSGSGARLGDFESRVYGAGPQIGYLFSVTDDVGGYVNLKGYKEFDAKNRAEGWNAWLTLSFAPAPEQTS